MYMEFYEGGKDMTYSMQNKNSTSDNKICLACSDSPESSPANCPMSENCKRLPHMHDERTEALVNAMPEIEVFQDVASVFSLISDCTRVKILWLLCHTEDCVMNIASAVDMSAPAVSHHLRVLKQAGMLKFRREGKETYYTLADTETAQTVHQVVDAVFNISH